MGSHQRNKCDLCVDLKCGRDNHKREWCYIDPASRVFKGKGELERRIQQAQSRGVVVPQRILDLLVVADKVQPQQNWVADM